VFPPGITAVAAECWARLFAFAARNFAVAAVTAL